MKRLLVLGMALLIFAPAVFADDANVMPARVGRLYLAPSYIFGSQSFDEDGNRVESADIKMLNLGVALEYGINSWITGAVQWTPGINLWSEVDAGLPFPGDAYIKDMGDLFVGAKLQIVGPAAPVRSTGIRLAFAPGVKIPMPGPDFGDELQSAMSGGDLTVATLDKHVLGAGLRSYIDFVINENFFINLFNEFIYYPLPGDLRNNSAYLALAALGASGDTEVNYGFDLTFELEPAFTFDLAPGVRLNAGLPVNYKLAPQPDIDMLIFPDPELTHLLTVKPGASIFFMGWALPMEFKLAYHLPVWGQYSTANNVVNFQWRVYFRI
ncbi:MAG: hypothetical protein FWH19_04310 [Treponema sp.]|nr:hypothetical protein [Treponema sp.]